METINPTGERQRGHVHPRWFVDGYYVKVAARPMLNTSALATQGRLRICAQRPYLRVWKLEDGRRIYAGTAVNEEFALARTAVLMANNLAPAPTDSRSRSTEKRRPKRRPSAPSVPISFGELRYQPHKRVMTAPRLVRDPAEQKRFRTDLELVYGEACMVSGIPIYEASHLVPWAAAGSHWQVGLLLNPTAHHTMDKGYWGINPTTLAIHVQGPYKLFQLGVYYQNIRYLEFAPHNDALWAHWEWFREQSPVAKMLAGA